MPTIMIVLRVTLSTNFGPLVDKHCRRDYRSGDFLCVAFFARARATGLLDYLGQLVFAPGEEVLG
jgi:hypothetical protein